MENDIHTEEEEDVRIYPSLLNRLQAMFFDFWIIVAIVMFLFVNFFDHYAGQFEGLKIGLFSLIVLIYEPLGSISGGTIGYRTMGLKIRRADGERKISVWQAYQRLLVKICLGCLSFMNISNDAQRRAIHDKASGTLVLYARSK